MKNHQLSTIRFSTVHDVAECWILYACMLYAYHQNANEYLVQTTINRDIYREINIFSLLDAVCWKF